MDGSDLPRVEPLKESWGDLQVALLGGKGDREAERQWHRDVFGAADRHIASDSQPIRRFVRLAMLKQLSDDPEYRYSARVA